MSSPLDLKNNIKSNKNNFLVTEFDIKLENERRKQLRLEQVRKCQSQSSQWIVDLHNIYIFKNQIII